MNNIITRYQIKESENNTWEDVSVKRPQPNRNQKSRNPWKNTIGFQRN